jgi:hypothetical protein
MSRKKTKTIVVKKLGNFLEIDGKWYFPKMHSKLNKGESLIFKEVDKQSLTGNINFLIKTLMPHLDKKMILRDALREMKPFELEKIADSIRTGRKPKIRKRYGCVELVVNGTPIMIR